MKEEELLYKLWEILRFHRFRQLEYPCEHCGYFECKKWNLKSFLKKRWAEEDFVDYKDCLKRKRAEFKELILILRNPIFRKYANMPCEKCGKKMFWLDMKSHSEIEARDPKCPKDSYKLEIFYLCPKCNRAYTRSKKPLHEGFEKR